MVLGSGGEGVGGLWGEVIAVSKINVVLFYPLMTIKVFVFPFFSFFFASALVQPADMHKTSRCIVQPQSI